MTDILLIEDDRWLADSYQKILAGSGWKVRLATNTEEAMQDIEEKLPSVIVADVALEGNTIFVLLNELQSYPDSRLVPVVLCTALDQPHLKPETLQRYGVVTVLNKATVTAEQLRDAVRTHVS